MPKKKERLNSLVKATHNFEMKTKMIKEEIEKIELKEKAKKQTEKVKTFLEDKGITPKIKTATDFTEKQLDILSGNKALKLVEERLILQEKYNDILATKLDEALSRIENLEIKLNDLYKSSQERTL